MHTHIKFHEIMVTLLWLILLILSQFRGNSSGTTKASLTKIDVDHFIIVIYFHFEFHEIQFGGYLVMAPDRQTEGLLERQTNGRKDKHGQNCISPPLAGDYNDAVWNSSLKFNSGLQGIVQLVILTLSTPKVKVIEFADIVDPE